MSKDTPNEYELLPPQIREQLDEWVEEGFRPTRFFYNHAFSSFGLKRLFRQQTGIPVSNGAIKGAMVKAGFLPKDQYEIVWYFRISRRSRALMERKLYEAKHE